MQTNYQEWLETKRLNVPHTGIDVSDTDINQTLFDFQRDIVRWSLKRGRAAIFASTGLGKTFMELEFAKLVPGRVLILAPLAVAQQTESIANNVLEYPVKYCRKDDSSVQTVITNYEMLDNFDPKDFAGLVLDESSIIKAFDGKLKQKLMEWSKDVPFKLSCTATPAPNDYMELGTQAEFLGIMRYHEMLAMFFVHDGGETAKWMLKRHGRSKFWEWISSWAIVVNNPSDLDYDGSRFDLPPLNVYQHFVAVDESIAHEKGMLFAPQVSGLDERRHMRKSTMEARLEKTLEIIGESDEPWLIWCDFNDESELLAKNIKGAVEVRGSQELEIKTNHLMDFTYGRTKKLVSKASITGYGMNWQHCRNMIFFGLSDSFERYYQAIRRCWRFGQTQAVNVHVIVSEAEKTVIQNVARKEEQLKTMQSEVVKFTKNHVRNNLRGAAVRETAEYKQDKQMGMDWTMHLGDCVDVTKTLADNSIDYTIFSPPFADLYVYSNSDRDMGNCKDAKEFELHFKFLVPELLRVTKPGRLLTFHCMDLPISKSREGFIGLRDFPGDLTRMFVDAGWIYHSKVAVWKDPVVAMQRTKALGLLHKQVKKDSARSRQGIADYLITVLKPGDNVEPVAHTAEEFPVALWQNVASPVWLDVNPTRTLQYRTAKSEDDVKHLCPLQLDCIEPCIELWSNKGDTVYSPFGGIGSEGYAALQMGRKFIGTELKEQYWDVACRNLAHAEQAGVQYSFFDNPIAKNWRG